MIIQVQQLDFTKPQPVGDGTAVGYWCEFQSELGWGTALFVPRIAEAGRSEAGRSEASRSEAGRYLGKQVEVGLGQGGIGDLQALPGRDGYTFQLRPMKTPGDFTAIGKVASIIWLDDELENAVIEVLLGPELIPVFSYETGVSELDFGQWISFRVNRLYFQERGN